MSNPRNLSSFTLIVTFVCLSLIGVVLVPLLPVKLAPSRTLPGLTVSFSMPGRSRKVRHHELYRMRCVHLRLPRQAPAYAVLPSGQKGDYDPQEGGSREESRGRSCKEGC